MFDKEKQFTRGECDRCGASLRRTKQRGKYHCDFCQAVYFDNNYSDNTWEEDQKAEPHLTVEPSPIYEPTVHLKESSKSGRLVAIVVSIVLLGGCFLVFVIGSLGTASNSNRSTSRSSNRTIADDKPQMLTTLPKAVKAGTAVAYDNWELTVYPEFTVSGNQLSFGFSTQNWLDQNQIIRFEPKTFIVYDDLGNTYPISLGNCAPDLPFLQRQISFSSYENIEFQSNRNWCNQVRYIPTFSGVISQNVKQLYFHFEEFGVFRKITFVFDL